MPPSVGVIGALKDSASLAAIIWLTAGPARLRLTCYRCRFTNVESLAPRRSPGTQANDEDGQRHCTGRKDRVADDTQPTERLNRARLEKLRTACAPSETGGLRPRGFPLTKLSEFRTDRIHHPRNHGGIIHETQTYKHIRYHINRH